MTNAKSQISEGVAHWAHKRRVGRPRKTAIDRPTAGLEDPRVLITKREHGKPREYWNGRAWTTLMSFALKLMHAGAIDVIRGRFLDQGRAIHLVRYNARNDRTKHRY